jgi:hypothetical protein
VLFFKHIADGLAIGLIVVSAENTDRPIRGPGSRGLGSFQVVVHDCNLDRWTG